MGGGWTGRRARWIVFQRKHLIERVLFDDGAFIVDHEVGNLGDDGDCAPYLDVEALKVAITTKGRLRRGGRACLEVDLDLRASHHLVEHDGVVLKVGRAPETAVVGGDVGGSGSGGGIGRACGRGGRGNGRTHCTAGSLTIARRSESAEQPEKKDCAEYPMIETQQKEPADKRNQDEAKWNQRAIESKWKPLKERLEKCFTRWGDNK